MTKTLAKIAKVQVVSYRRAGWPEWKVREITERGAVRVVATFGRGAEARIFARSLAITHGAKLVAED